MRRPGNTVLTTLWYLLQIATVSALVYYLTRSVALLNLDVHHDGILLKPAIDVAQGKMLFRDTFTQYGAFLTLIHAWLLQTFGPHLYVLRLATVWVYVLTGVLMWILWKQFLPSIFASLTVVVWILLAGFYEAPTAMVNWGVFLSWSPVFTFPFTLLGAIALVRWLKSGGGGYIFLTGVLFAFVFWIRQNTGGYLFLAVLTTLLVARWKQALPRNWKWFLVGTGIVHTAFIAWLIANDALIYWFKDSILFAYQWQKAVATQDRFPFFLISCLLPVSLSAVSVWILFPAAALMQGYRLIKKKSFTAKQMQLAWMIILTLWCWLQYYPMDDVQHTFWAITPVVGMYVYTAVYPPLYRRHRMLFFLICMVLLVPDTFLRARMWKHKTTRYPYKELAQPPIFRHLLVSPEEYAYITELNSAVQKYKKAYPDITIVNAGPNALNSLYLEKQSGCSRYHIDWKWGLFSASTETQHRSETQNCIRTLRPLVIASEGYWQPKDYIQVTPKIPNRDYLLVPREKYLKPAR